MLVPCDVQLSTVDSNRTTADTQEDGRSTAAGDAAAASASFSRQVCEKGPDSGRDEPSVTGPGEVPEADEPG